MREDKSNMEVNPYLRRVASDRDSAKGSVEKVEDIENIVWQTRAELPSDYENRLGDLLELVFEAGIEELPGVVAKLNELGGRAPDGSPWTEASFQSVMRQLGKE